MRLFRALTCSLVLVGCGQGDVGTTSETSQQQHQLTAQEAHGREVWLKSTFGGEKFFTLVGPAVMGFHLGFDAMLTTPRAVRFTNWGVVNDPDCTQGSLATGGLDVCPWEVDADGPVSSAGVVGIRKRPNPLFNPAQPPSANNSPYLIGAPPKCRSKNGRSGKLKNWVMMPGLLM